MHHTEKNNAEEIILPLKGRKAVLHVALKRSAPPRFPRGSAKLKTPLAFLSRANVRLSPALASPAKTQCFDAQ